MYLDRLYSFPLLIGLVVLFFTGCGENTNTPLPASPDSGSLSQTDTRETDLWTQARQLVGENKLTDAIPVVLNILESEPNNPEAHYYKAFCLQHTGNHEPALEAYEKALSLNPGEEIEFYVCFNRGVLFLGLNRLDEAEKDLHRALELKSDHEQTRQFIQEIETRKANTSPEN